MGVRNFVKDLRSISTAIIAVLAVSFVLSCPVSSADAVIPVQKGVCYVSWDKESFESEFSDASLEKLAYLGVNYISLIVTHYQESTNSTEIKSTEQTSTDTSIKHVIRKAHELGIKVMLKPHIDLVGKFDGTYCRSDIGFSKETDWQAWFKSYQKFILRYAKIAEKMNVELFCVGTELEFTTQRTDLWRAVIAEVRKTYKGKLVYAANWDEYSKVEFWKDLDFVGIDAYFPLSYVSNPSLDELKKGWQKWMSEISTWQNRINKPIIFTEIGYTSSSTTPSAPWEVTTTGNADPEMQAKCYQAFFDTAWSSPWLAGVYWWKWDTNTKAGGVANRQYTPQNKPAERIMEAHYKGFKADSSVALAK